MLHAPCIDRKRKLLTFSYTRYADDWILLTNANKKVCEKIKITDLNKKFDARTTLGPRIGIDHARVMEKLEENQVIIKKEKRKEKKQKTRHVGIFCSLKEWEIVTKFAQIIRGIFNYYYYYLTGKSDLNKYYYLH